jgi:hypothetical protein
MMKDFRMSCIGLGLFFGFAVEDFLRAFVLGYAYIIVAAAEIAICIYFHNKSKRIFNEMGLMVIDSSGSKSKDILSSLQGHENDDKENGNSV